MAENAGHNEVILGQFSQQAESYAKLTGSMAAGGRQAEFRAQAAVRPDDVVLDVCCGPGTLGLDLAPYVTQVTGLDLTPAMLEQARAAQARRGAENIEWVQGDVLDIPFGDAAFSLVVCGAAFHHMTAPKQAFAELVRVCRIGGRVVVRDVTPAAEKSAEYDRMEKLRDPSHTHALTAAEMAALGEGLPVAAPALHASVTADVPLDAVLQTSFPEACGISDIRAIFLEDAQSGEDRLGFSARVQDGAILVSYRQTTAVWRRV